MVLALASALSAHAWAGLAPPRPAATRAWVTLRTDPEPAGRGVRAVADLDGRRVLLEAYGGVGRRLRSELAGVQLLVVGRSGPVPPNQRARWAARHVGAVVAVESVLDRAEGAPYGRAANRVRRLLESGVASWPATERALFLGLVIGDDRAQPTTLVDDFRTAGLSHLTAVSGQNVAFVLIAASPLLRRLRPTARWGATVILVMWFAALTRFEPSVLRATGMAALAATAFWRGWRAGPVRLLALSVLGLTLVDPLLVHSVGWWLSVGATGGLALFARPLAGVVPGPTWFSEPLAVTLAAQLGILPISLLVFGRVSLLGPIANLLAVPVAGFVMVWGIPAGLVAGAVPVSASILHAPSLVATRWVAVVAQLAARLEPGWSPVVVTTLQGCLLGGVIAGHRHRRRRRSALASDAGPELRSGLPGTGRRGR